MQIPAAGGHTSDQPHRWHIPEREYARHESRRGRRFAYEQLSGPRTALVVVDMVDFFVESSPRCLSIVPRINTLAAALREVGGTLAWVLPEQGQASAWAEEFYGRSIAARYASCGGAGALPERLWAGLDHLPSDLWAEKSASSAFFPGRSTLPDQLSDAGIDTIIVTGTVTSVCCEATARDAATLGYRVVFAADANAGVDDASHNATLRTIYRSFGDVRETSDIFALL